MSWLRKPGANRGGADSPLDAHHVGIATLGFGPRRVAASLVLTLIALVMPQVPDRLLVSGVCFASALVQLGIHRRASNEARLAYYAVSDILLATVIGLLVTELWTISLLVGTGAVMIATSASRSMPRGLLSVGFAMSAVPGAIAVGLDAAPAICAATTILLLDYWLKEMVIRVSAHDDDVLRRSLETSASLVHLSSLGVDQTVSVQGPVEAITGYTPHEWKTIDHRALIHPDDFDDFWILEGELEEGRAFDRKARFRRADGRWTWLRDLSVVARENDGKLYLRGFTVDITEIEEAHALIKSQAETDHLTGLANRSVLLDRMNELLANDQPFGLLLMDLDRFKLINDTMGHPVGDEVLKTIATRLDSELSGSDLVCRLGGDEFAIVAPSATDELSAARLAARLHDACTRTIRHHDIDLQLDTSIGVVLAADGSRDAATLMRSADLAMYRAKSEHVSHRFFVDEMVETSVEDLQLSAALPAAIESREVTLYFQPKIDLTTGAIVGFEGLARWVHPELGVLGPDRFLHLITVSDVEKGFVDSVVEQGVQFAARCREAGHTLPIAVNLATQAFLDETLPGRVRACLDRHRQPAGSLVIEITELGIMNRLEGSAHVMDRWSALGVGISVDDFGTGYSSYARLVDMPISEVKIDRRFVQGAPTSRRDEIIVESVADLARRMHIGLVAEGVENLHQADLLLNAGCRQAQGYFFSRPVDRERALALLGHRFSGWGHLAGDPLDEVPTSATAAGIGLPAASAHADGPLSSEA